MGTECGKTMKYICHTYMALMIDYTMHAERPKT